MSYPSRDEILASSKGWVASFLNFLPGLGSGYLYQRRWKPYFFTIIASTCLLYTSDAADDCEGVDLGGRRIIKKIFSSRRRHTRSSKVSWARRCV